MQTEEYTAIVIADSKHLVNLELDDCKRTRSQRSWREPIIAPLYSISL